MARHVDSLYFTLREDALVAHNSALEEGIIVPILSVLRVRKTKDIYKYVSLNLLSSSISHFLKKRHHISRDFDILKMRGLSYLYLCLYLSLARVAWSSFSLPRSTVNGACTGLNGAPGVCIPTSSCSDSGGKYISNACPGTPDDIKCCTKASCGDGGNCRWTSQCSGTTVPNLCPGPSSFECCEPSSGGSHSTIGGKISRSEIISRGESWISQHVPYSQTETYPDPEGIQYRTDCSGFVSMALHSSPPGRSTVTLPEIATEVTWDALQPGDFVGTLGAGTEGDSGHVTLFHSWADSTKKNYNSLECRGQAYGCVSYQRPIGWTDDGRTSKPYKYIQVE